METRTVLVCLGLALRPDGSLDPMLEERCKLAADIHKERNIPIINTGGDPRKTGKTEAKAMTEYMVKELGVSEKHIFLEEEAYNTRTNAIFTFKMMEKDPNWIGNK